MDSPELYDVRQYLVGLLEDPRASPGAAHARHQISSQQPLGARPLTRRGLRRY